jgi:putative phosphoribosyl transferase
VQLRRSADDAPFADRRAAGAALGAAVRERLAGSPAAGQGAVVLGLPRGGVPVAAEVASALGAPLDVFVVRKLGAPGQPELAMGAIATGGVRVLNEDLLRRLGASPEDVAAVAAREGEELRRRERAYRGDRDPLPLTGRCVVVVDDGLATGASVLAAVQAVRATGPGRVLVAVPVGAPEACRRVAAVADDVVCLRSPRAFGAVGAHYRDFTQTTDDEVRALLR